MSRRSTNESGLPPDVDADHLQFEFKTRIDTARGSVQRARIAFLVLNLASMALLLLTWNYYFSWYRFFAQDPALKDNSVRMEFVRNWVRTQFMPASTLGVNFGAADASVLGGVILLILALWFYFAARRENHTTARLLDDALRVKFPAIRRAVFWAIADEHIFLTWSGDDKPDVISLTRPQHAVIAERPDRIVRWSLRTLFFLPVIAVLAAWCMDVYSLLALADFRDTTRPLWRQLPSKQLHHALVVLAGSGLLACLLAYVLIRITEFNSETVRALREFAEKVPEIPNPAQPPKRRSKLATLKSPLGGP